MVLAVGAVAGAALAGSHAGVVHAATATDCEQDGLVMLCADTKAASDAVALEYEITQSDGPGTYTLYYVDARTGAKGPVRDIDPLANGQVVDGALLAHVGHCYDLHLDSVEGTSVVVPSLCG
jgi:hypothetical protein